MKADRPSRTAQMVALGRAMANTGISHVPGFRDPTAQAFLSSKGKQSLGRAEQAIRTGRPAARVEMARTMADLMALRTSAIDAAVRDAVAGGASQLVVLGAGYDGRAWRMPELAGVKVFEVDRPGTQRDKQARVAQLTATAASVTFVPTDFERESLSTTLERAGHDRSVQTCWIWEGVVMYLTRDAVLATLRSVAARSASGSTLIVNYHSAHRGWLGRLFFRLIGEPQISAWTPDEMAADLRTVGFIVAEDAGMLDWNARFAAGQAKVQRASQMRAVVARLPLARW